MDSPLAGSTTAGRTEAPSADEVRAALARVLESREFRAARNRARLLEYVVNRTLQNNADSLKEYTLGLEVFQRGAGFDPRTDGVVRTQAGLARKHLQRYYAAEGYRDPVEIVLPKGHYIPQFEWRTVSDALPPRDAPALGFRWTAASIALVAAIAAAAAGAFGFLGRTRHSATVLAGTVDAIHQPIWGPFLQPGATNVLAFGIPQFFTADGSGIWVRDVEVNSPAVPPASDRLETISRKLGPLHPGEVYTGIGEAYGVHALTRFFLRSGRDVRVIRSPGVSWDNVKHDNVIFLTSARFKTLADQLSYPSEYFHALGSPNRVVSVHPAPGEPATYIAVNEGPMLVDYAIVSVWPGKLPGRRVLVLRGSYTWGTQAAAEYVTERAYLQHLSDHLLACRQREGAARHPEFFQVLLRVEARDGQSTGMTLVSHRDLALTDTGGRVEADTASAAR